MRNKLSIILILLIAVFGYENCAMPGSGMSSASQSSLSSTGTTLGVAPEAQSTTGTSVPYSLMSADQLVRSMIQVTGITSISGVQGIYANQQTLGGGYDLSEINAPMMVGITNVAYQSCIEMITEERAITTQANRRYTSDIDITKVPAMAFTTTNNAYNLYVTKLANGFWGRDATSDEMAVMNDALTGYLATLSSASPVITPTTTHTRNIEVQACIIMLSSFDSISL